MTPETATTMALFRLDSQRRENGSGGNTEMFPFRPEGKSLGPADAASLAPQSWHE
jgi:hypothetical protein